MGRSRSRSPTKRSRKSRSRSPTKRPKKSRSRSPTKRAQRSRSSSPTKRRKSNKKKHHHRSSSHSKHRDYRDRESRRDCSEERDPRSKSSNEPSTSTSSSKHPDGYFDLKKIKYLVDRMFFRDSDVIRKGTPQYDDFWKFYEKMQVIRRKGMSSKLDGKLGSSEKWKKIHVGETEVEVPEVYSKKHTIPFSLKYTDINEYIYKLNPEDQEYVRKAVPESVLLEFLQTILYFLDFLQKERFLKLKKLREAQSALPIANYREKIIETLQKHNVLIIAGDTGCGKSTQVPQYLLKAGYTNIACTQPRRIACISLCKRVAYETLNEYGSAVGYQIRFEKSKTQHTKIIFVTEGLLLRQVSTDSMLTNYNVIVLDEVHERHLHGDFLLGIVKCLVYQREDVKVILMSATINTELFQDYFQGLAPILTVPGRLHTIKMQYRPISVEEMSTKTGKLNPAPYVRILQLIDDKFPQDERGDVLMFLSGMNEISFVVEAAKMYAEVTKRWVILPLHSMLSIEDQDKVFDYPPEGVRKCIVATNIAETSITIDGIRFVVDSGKMKEMAYDPSCKMQRLKEFWVSKASAEQRKGRAGRTGPGICYRLYGEAEYNELEPFSTPEIQRVPLDSLLLQMISIGIPDCRKFPFIEPPSIDSMESSMARLKEQGALTDDEQLTAIGKTLSQLPVDITIGKMLIMGTLFEQIDAVLSLAAALSVQSPYTNWAHRDLDAAAARKSLESDHGDPLTLLNAYRAWLEEKACDSNRTKKWCKRRGLEEQRFYEMTKLRQQFKSLLKDSNLIKEQQGFSLSSNDRAMRHGELKQLRNLKKEYHNAAPRKKKFLKLEDSEHGGAEDADNSDQEGDGQIDIRDVEFRLRNDSHQVKDLLDKSTPYGYEDISMLKVILCSGLYPQLAIPDDFNKFKNDTDQVFHTKGKGFTLLHPTSIFSNQTDVLKLTESDIIIVPHMATKLSISSRHQLLVYLTLLETNKPYLLNCFRMPAVQALFLFSHSIDTDPTFSRFVFDSWLEVEFVDASAARIMVITAAVLRDIWIQLLSQRLSDKEAVTTADQKKARELSHGLVSFLRTETFYTIKRLLAADQKDLYDRSSHFDVPDSEDNLSLETDWEMKPNVIKGGICLTSFLNYACLYGEMPDPEAWTCPICESNLMGMPLELLFHQLQCKREKQKVLEKEIETEEEDVKARPFANAYQCPKCERQLQLTPMEILRHKKSHLDKTND